MLKEPPFLCLQKTAILCSNKNQAQSDTEFFLSENAVRILLYFVEK